MKTFLALFVSAALGILSTPSSKAIPYVNLVNNGSFESGDVGWGYTYNWGVGSGFSAADGGNFAEVYGTIFQTISTVPGTQYDFRVALAGNLNISQSQTINVDWGNTTLGSVTWSPAGHTIGNLGWVYGDFHVFATSPNTVITIENPYVGDGSGRIARVDAISVSAVPDTSIYLTPAFGFVLAGLFWMKMRNRRTV